MAPKIKIKITGKIKPKNRPNLFLRYPRLKTLKSANILFPLDIFHSLIMFMVIQYFAVLTQLSADKFNENVV